MYIISDNDLKESVYSALSSQTREFRQRLSFGEGIGSSFNKQISFDAGIKKIEISQVGNADNNGLVLGNCCSSSATVEFYNPKNTYRYNDKTMFVECGIKLDDGEYFYIPCGYYKVEKPETDDDWKTVKMTAYDVVDEMSGKWNTALTMPTTSYLLIKEIADKYNLELEIDPIILLGLQKRQITESEASMLTAYKEREVVGFLVGCLGGNARVNTVGKLYVGIYNPFPQEIINIETNVQWQNGFKKTLETEFEISSITSGVGDDVFTAGTGKGLTFVNPLITEEEIAEIYENYSGFTFQPSACEWRGNPCVECGDVVFVFDKSGNYYTVFVARQDIDLTGGLSMTTHCPSGDSDVSFDTLDDEIRQALNKQYTDLQQAIVDATSKINGALGGYYEVLDSDNDGNPDGWLIKEHEDGTGGIIRANKAGIALSKDGGKNYRTAITYDGINAYLITSGKVKAEFIEADKLVVSKGNVTGLDTELADLLKAAEDAESKANTAQNTANNANSTASSALSTANTANSTANTASTNASNALSVANSANGKIASWASANNTTLIDGAKIYTGSITAKQIESGSITADKLAIGLNNTNYAATEDWEGDTDYLSFSFDSNNSYKPKISMTFSATSLEKRLKLNKSFYVTAGSKLYCSAIAYADGTSNASNTYVGIGLSYSSSLNGDYSLSQYDSSHNLSLKTEHKIGFDTTVNQSGYYRIEVWFNKCNNKAYLKDIFVAQGIPGEIVVNGKISSVDGKTYFDLDNSIIKTVSSNYQTEMSGGSLKFNNSTDVLYGGLQIGKLSSKDSAVNANVWYYTDESEGISIGKKDSGDLIIPMFSVDDSGVVFNSTTTSTTFYSNTVAFNSLIEFNKNVDCYGKFTVDTVILKNNGGIKGQYTSGETTDDHLIGKINENDTVVLGWHSPKVSINVSEKEVAFWDSKTYCLQNGIKTIQITPTNNTGISETSSRYIVGDFTTNGGKIVRRLRFSPYHSDGSYGVSIDDDTNAGTVWFRPTADNYLTLGSASYKWNNIYAYTSAIGTSDKTMKRDIKNIESNYEEIFYSLKPVSFKFIDGKRTHLGFIAQDVEEAMINAGLTPNDFAALCKDPINDNGDEMSCTEENYQNAANILYGLRYSEFIPLCVHMIQKLQNKVNELEEKLNDR